MTSFPSSLLIHIRIDHENDPINAYSLSVTDKSEPQVWLDLL